MNHTITYFFIAFLISNTLSAQQKNSNNDNLLFNNYHLTFQIGYLNNQVQQKGTIKQGHFNTYAGKGGFVGGILTINPFKNLGLEVGANISLQNFGYDVNLSAVEFGLENDFALRQSVPEMYIELPLTIVPRLAINNYNWLYFRAGMSMSWYSPLSIDFNLKANPKNPKETGELGTVNMTFNGDNPYFSVLSGIGYQHLTKGKDLIGVSLNANFGFNNIMEGTYTIWNNEMTVGDGQFSSKGSYVSLVFSYTFTGMKKLEEEINKRIGQ